MAEPASPVPPGFVEYPPVSPFLGLFGPMYARDDADGTTTIGLRLASIHMNHQGTAHGGMLASIADNSLGFNVARAMGGPVATVHLSLDYLDRCPVGEWLEARTLIDRRGGRMCFAQCTAFIGGRPVLKASGVFSAIRVRAAG